MAGREAGSPGELIAGHMDQVKSQWAASEVAAVTSFQSTVPPRQRPDLPLVSQPCAWRVFCQHLSATRKDRACKNQGSVFNIIMTALKTVIITQNEREKRRTSLGKLWGEKTDHTLLFYHHRSLQKLIHFTLGAQPAETWCPNRRSCNPRYRVWGLCGSHPIHMGQDPVPGNPISVLHLQCVLSPRWVPTSELRVLTWLTCGPFSSLHRVAFTWGQAPLCGLLLCVLLSENLWWCHINITAYPLSNPRGHHCLVSPTLSSDNLIHNLIVILYWSTVGFCCLFRCIWTWFSYT